MIDTTDDYYYQVSSSLPEIEDEIDNTIEETNILISYFVNPEGDETEDKSDQKYILKEIIVDLEEKINTAYQSLMNKDEFFNRLSGFIGDSEGGQADFEQIIELIKGLQGVLKKLKYLSINAGIHAYQVGKKGAGFKVVAREINKISHQAEVKYTQLEEQVIELRKWYQNFWEEIEGAIEFEEKIKQKFQGEINKVMDDIISSLNIVSKLLKDFTGQINWAVEPIGEILVYVQNQDIIKQNLENLLRIIESTRIENSTYLKQKGENPEDILNFLVFMDDVSRLGSKLMTNILEQLNASLFSIKEQFDDIETRLQEIFRDTDFVVEFLTGNERDLVEVSGEGEEDSSLKFIYQDVLNFIPRFKKELKEIGSRYEQLTGNQDYFNQFLENIKQEFVKINRMAEQLDRIELFAKIELSRIDENNKFIRDFNEVIGKFVETSSREQRVFADLKGKLQDNYDDFKELAVDNQDKLKLSSESISQSREQLELTKKLINDAIQALSQNLNNLGQQIFELNRVFARCIQLEDIANDVKKYFAEIGEEVVKNQSEYVSQVNVEEWEESSEHLESLIEQFTSYVERKTAQEEFGDLDMDVGGQQGELTLF